LRVVVSAGLTCASKCSALGSGLTATLHLALKTGAEPEQALLHAVEGAIGMFKSAVAGGPPEGPSPETLLRVLLEIDELDKGNRGRWFFKLIPSIALALVKKPALVLKAQKYEEASGKVSPKSYEAEMAGSKGRAYSALKSVKEICKLSWGVVTEGIHTWVVTKPLRALSGLNPESRSAGWLSRSSSSLLEKLEAARTARLDKKMQTYVAQIPDGPYLAELDDASFEVHALRKYIDYRYNTEGSVSQEEMAATLGYWNLRKVMTWKSQHATDLAHVAELKSIDPRVADVRALLRPKSGILGQIGRKLRDPHGTVSATGPFESSKAFTNFVESLQRTELAAKSASLLVLDAASNGGPIVALNPAGGIEVLSGATGRAALLERAHRKNEGSADGFEILAHADDARIAVAEMLLASKLEPFQRMALLKGHRDLMSGKVREEDVARMLAENNFSQEQLYGARDMSQTVVTPGLLPLGVIGRAWQG